ncbi:hypothetical protein RKT74_13390 [Leclercia pneumoniae]|uniref:hypothetical protein n=1 Tax=Leclercia pneumoniae TaxID=2815358 RepID=UPI0021E5D669|nr:hypothetical protein [Leclercia pneumoniae]MCV2510169.1 hypothetical protein [Leclercia pneumoniae]WNN79724.1 hypothetical protein RKT74_13390 [Leclercia pneumoniae]
MIVTLIKAIDCQGISLKNVSWQYDTRILVAENVHGINIENVRSVSSSTPYEFDNCSDINASNNINNPTNHLKKTNVVNSEPTFILSKCCNFVRAAIHEKN